MTKESIERSFLDEKFRETCVQILNSASQDVYIIAGELGSLKFYDLRKATERASKRGAKIHVYATEYTPETFRNYVISRGYNLFIGTEGLPEHYLMVDGKHVVMSKNKQVGKMTVVGEREADVYRDEPEKAKKVFDEFERLTSKIDTHKITEFDKTKDPFYKMIFAQ